MNGELKVSSKKPGEKFTYGNDNQWEAGIWMVKKLQVQRAHKNTDPTAEYTSCYRKVGRRLSLWTPLSTTPDMAHRMACIKKKKHLRTTCRLHSISLFVEKHLFDEVVLLSIRKYLQGHLRWHEFRVGSYRKIQRHLSLGSSVTMALGGGPRSRQPSSVSCVLILRLNTLSCSTCFGSPPIILQIVLFIHRDQLLSRHLPEPLFPCFPQS